MRERQPANGGCVFALAPSHNDQRELPEGGPGLTTAYGTGRFENFAVLYRQPIGPADSIEVGWVRHKNDSTDGVNLGGSNYTLSEQRLLGSERDDFGLGWRHRFQGLELALSGRYTTIDASNATARISPGPTPATSTAAMPRCAGARAAGRPRRTATG